MSPFVHREWRWSGVESYLLGRMGGGVELYLYFHILGFGRVSYFHESTSPQSPKGTNPQFYNPRIYCPWVLESMDPWIHGFTDSLTHESTNPRIHKVMNEWFYLGAYPLHILYAAICILHTVPWGRLKIVTVPCSCRLLISTVVCKGIHVSPEGGVFTSCFILACSDPCVTLLQGRLSR